MGTMQTSIVFLCGTLFLYLFFIFIKFLHKVWWTPIQIQQAMRLQGIKHPFYRFLYGSTKEILNMRKESNGKPMELSHYIFPKIQPHCTLGSTSVSSLVSEAEFVKDIMNNKDKSYPKNEPDGFIKKLWLLRSADDIESKKLKQGICKSIIRTIVKREKAMNVKVDSFGNDFLGLLVKVNYDADEGKRITVDDVVDECKTFYTAGHETTISLLTWTVLLLGIHTDWQEKARQEMNMIINESLRLYPPVVLLPRIVKHEAKLGKFSVPANTTLVIPTLSIHHDTQIRGEDAQQFKPKRYSEGVAKATNNNLAVFLPFGLGPRSCVGLKFGLNEAKIALIMMLQRYAFTLSPAYIHSPIVMLTSRPQHGVQNPLADKWDENKDGYVA
ncbi:hypothetical protein RJ640_008051 [Escallonia rubra]|uniref:Cytochrome P450 n=1 Tax=Escallonia rubra TaxID=112253 RepID=A0AA88RB29_9ASTE|nr:hypothetical protein RJ640_008051 [Escallonia rubra]